MVSDGGTSVRCRCAPEAHSRRCRNVCLGGLRTVLNVTLPDGHRTRRYSMMGHVPDLWRSSRPCRCQAVGEWKPCT
jgi:hypothetical protein